MLGLRDALHIFGMGALVPPVQRQTHAEDQQGDGSTRALDWRRNVRTRIRARVSRKKGPAVECDCKIGGETGRHVLVPCRGHREWMEANVKQERERYANAAEEIERLRRVLNDALSNLDHIVEAQIRTTHNYTR